MRSVLLGGLVVAGCGGNNGLTPEDGGPGNTGMVGSGGYGGGLDGGAFIDASAHGGSDGGGAPSDAGGPSTRNDGGGQQQEAGPSTGGMGDGGTDGGGSSIGVVFNEPPGFFSTLAWTISGPNSYSGAIDFGAAASVEFVIGGIQEGDGYSLFLSGLDAYGDMCSGASTPFAVVPGEVASVGLSVTCQSGDGGPASVTTGSVSVDAGVLLTGR